jgi:diguanylate cyclase (GGDEF)-like protein/PAS domain S-box-containing protein
VFESLFEGVYIVDQNRKIIFWNKGSEKITGFKAEEVVNNHCFNNILQHVDDKGNELCFNGCPLHKTLQTGVEMNNNVFLHHKDGHRVPVSVRTIPLKDTEGSIVAAIEVFTDQRYRKDYYYENKRLQEMLITDELTQVYNRRYIDYQLDSFISEYEKFSQSFGVVFIDIDNFKLVNDKYGHNIGDEILKLVSRTVNTNIRSKDVFGRWGGEEFILLVRTKSIDHLKMITEKLRVLVEHSSYKDDNHDISVTVSLGGVIFNGEMNKDKVIEIADKNMYEAKSTGRNKVIIK